MDRFKTLSLIASRGALLWFVLVVIVGLSGCTESKDAYAQLRTPRAALIDGFESYISAADARTRLPRELSVRVLFEWKTPADDQRPRFDELTLRVSGFVHVGVKGDLDLEFVNDRLVRTVFSASDCSTYLKALKPVGVSVSEGRWRSGFTEMWIPTSKSPGHVSCAAWADTSLHQI
jgi:hypothetical protein